MSGTPPRVITVDLGDRSYEIYVGFGLIEEIGTLISDLLQLPRVFVVTDTNVGKTHLEPVRENLESSRIEVISYSVPAGEKSKSFESLQGLLNHLLEHQAERSDLVIALGGGMVGDLTGLAASLLKRGMNLLQIPTTLLAQVDSSVGGKTAINTDHGKNLIGTFYQPQRVLIDTNFLTTLPRREILAGYAEIVKYGLIRDHTFFSWLDSHASRIISLEDHAILVEAITKSCEYKARIVQSDEREGNVRQILNFGHTFGHALEAENQYSDSLLHGEAVGCGMGLATKYSQRLGMINEETVSVVINSLNSAGLTTNINNLCGGPYVADRLVRAMGQDKKSKGGKTPLILLNSIGTACIRSDIDMSDVQSFMVDEVKN